MLSSLRWNKVLRDMWRHKARSVLVVLAISIGVALLGIIVSARAITIRDMYAGYWASNAPHVKLFLDSFEEDLLPSVAHLASVADVLSEQERIELIRLLKKLGKNAEQISVDQS